ncbi:MAG: hypothetical protein QM728_02305 [Gordonia sp. (in: high G+C Gram-positive bacteria)]|uniref:hypothetical protein n=1 Tax=Gordonia sp. (in: high G+C Gram-positive bacteria) TaxID=84139 RepID=UPI0039E525C0
MTSADWLLLAAVVGPVLVLTVYLVWTRRRRSRALADSIANYEFIEKIGAERGITPEELRKDLPWPPPGIVERKWD